MTGPDMAESVRDARREALLDRLADHVLAHGLSAASLRPLARAASTSDRMLLYYFDDKNDLIAAILVRLGNRLRAMLDGARVTEPKPASELLPILRAHVTDDALWPYMQLWLDLAAGAARGNALYRRVGEGIGRGFFDWLVSQISQDDMERRDHEAARLLTLIEGMVLLKSLGLDDVGERAL